MWFQSERISLVKIHAGFQLCFIHIPVALTSSFIFMHSEHSDTVNMLSLGHWTCPLQQWGLCQSLKNCPRLRQAKCWSLHWKFGEALKSAKSAKSAKWSVEKFGKAESRSQWSEWSQWSQSSLVRISMSRKAVQKYLMYLMYLFLMFLEHLKSRVL